MSNSVNILLTALTIVFCSANGGKGIQVFTIFSLDMLGCAPPPPIFINSSLWDNKKKNKNSLSIPLKVSQAQHA